MELRQQTMMATYPSINHTKMSWRQGSSNRTRAKSLHEKSTISVGDFGGIRPTREIFDLASGTTREVPFLFPKARPYHGSRT